MKLRLWDLGQWLTFGAVFVIAVFVVWFGRDLFRGPAADYKIIGGVVEVSTQEPAIKISISAVQKDGAVKPVTTTQKTATILVNTDTKFVKTVLHRPSKETLAKTKGVWDMKTVKTEIIPGSLANLPKGASILIKTSTNNPTGTSFVASEVDYFTIVD